jgi:geranylgeranyl reductase family protein
MKPKVLIVGAGPAGIACGIELSRKGFETVVLEKGKPGRDKICGDAILPDAEFSLQYLGIKAEVLAGATRIQSIRLVRQKNQEVSLPLSFATLQRTQLDRRLQESAEKKGVQVRHETEIVDAQVTPLGVLLCDRNGKSYEGDVLVLATGAVSTLPKKLGLPLESYSAASVRGYLKNKTSLKEAIFWFGKEIFPGYAWIFPAPENTLNVGVSAYLPRSSEKEKLHHCLKYFVDHVAAQWTGGEKFDERPMGFPLKTGLKAKKSYGDRVLLIGDAGHTAFDVSGEGIGPALKSGILAAGVLARVEGHFGESSLAAYPKDLQASMGRLHWALSYAKRLNQYALINSLFAQLILHSSKARTLLSKVLLLEEGADALFSFKGLLKNIFTGY